MTSSKTLLIETSAAIDIAFGKPSSAAARGLTKGYDKTVLAHYSKMELKRGFLQYVVYLHNKLVGLSRLSDVQLAISNLSSTRQRHRLGTVLEVMTEFWRRAESITVDDINREYGPISLNDYLMRKLPSELRLMVRQVWRRLDSLTDEVINPMNCFEDIAPPMIEGELLNNKPSQCGGSELECRIKPFVREHRDQFKRIHSRLSRIAISDRDQETSKRIKSLHQILRAVDTSKGFSNRYPNCRQCWDCGDAILAVVAPENSDVLNHNGKHYDPICEAIGRRSVTY